MKILAKILVITCLGLFLTGCEKDLFPPIDAIYSQDILGKWKITYVKEVTIEEEVIKTTNYKSKNIIFDFVSTERMNINKDGYLPKGEYAYSYKPFSNKYYATDCVADIDTRNLEMFLYEEQGKVVYRYYCYRVEGSDEMVLSNHITSEVREVICLKKIN